MLKRLFIIILTLLSLSLGAQNYQAPKVEKSSQILKINGSEYYSHKVLPRQTLYSISKAYEVTVEEITAANPTVAEKGLQSGTTIIIPVHRKAAAVTTAAAASSKAGSSKAATSASSKPQQQQAATSAQPSSQASPKASAAKQAAGDILYTTHVVRWFETLNDIANKYNVPKDVIMAFNGLDSERLQSRQALKIPSNAADFARIRSGEGLPKAEQTEETAVAENVASEATKDTVAAKPNKGLFRNIISSISNKKEASVALLLPFNLKAENTPDSLGNYPKPSPDYKDFYSGVLLACRDAGLAGIKVNLDVYDISEGGTPVTAIPFAGKDVVIGPVVYKDVKKTLAVLPQNVNLVSPLSRNIDTLALKHPNFISAPAQLDREDLIDWMIAHSTYADNIVVISEDGVALDSLFKAKMRTARMNYIPFSYKLLDNKDIEIDMSEVFTTSRHNVVYIASTNNAFIADAVRNLHILATFKEYNFPISLYADGAIVNLPGSEIDNFHSTNLHCLAGFYIDYAQPEVISFVADYRALFGAEPSRFAFQGYDVASYFISLVSEFGESWSYFLGENRSRRMLQTDFKFKKLPNGGYINTAARKLEYDKGYDVKLTPLK